MKNECIKLSKFFNIFLVAWPPKPPRKNHPPWHFPKLAGVNSAAYASIAAGRVPDL